VINAGDPSEMANLNLGLLWEGLMVILLVESANLIAEAGGWECVEMVRKYAHLASDHLVQYADRMSGLRLVHDGEAATMGLRATK
jgi:hypothetical protein